MSFYPLPSKKNLRLCFVRGKRREKYKKRERKNKRKEEMKESGCIYTFIILIYKEIRI